MLKKLDGIKRMSVIGCTICILLIAGCGRETVKLLSEEQEKANILYDSIPIWEISYWNSADRTDRIEVYIENEGDVGIYVAHLDGNLGGSEVYSGACYIIKDTEVQPKSYDFDSVVNSSGSYDWREVKGQSGDLEWDCEWDEDTKRQTIEKAVHLAFKNCEENEESN